MPDRPLQLSTPGREVNVRKPRSQNLVIAAIISGARNEWIASKLVGDSCLCSRCFWPGRSFSSFAAEDWKQIWERTIDAAKREGEVVIYGPHNPMYRSLWDTFQKNYPGIKINFVPGKGAERTQKVLAERRAGKYIADLIMGGSSSYRSYPPGTLEPLRLT